MPRCPTAGKRACATVVRAVLLLASLAAALYSSGTTVWEMNTYADFIRGRFEGISLSREGRLSLAPKMETVFSSDQPVIWGVAEAPDGTLYAATGHRGRVYRIDRSGHSSVYWTADEPEVFAIAVDRSGAVYAGTSPAGKVYRIVAGKATEFFAPKTRYIWTLAFGPDGSLYVGTGDQGKVFRVDASGKGELYYDTGQSHITGLAVDGQGRVLAGTEPNGILYRISAKNKAFVLYDSSLPEIRSIVPMPDGTIYAAALGGAVARQAQAAAQAAQASGNPSPAATATTTITVEAQAGPPGTEIKPPAPAQAAQPAATPQVSTQFNPVVDVSGVEKSAVYRINPDNTVETLWSSKDENAFGLLALDRQLVFSTDQDGRIYGLAPDRQVTLIAQTNQGQAVRLLPSNHSILAATGNMGRIFRLSDSPGNSGFYEAPVHDSGTASHWGSVSWRADVPAGTTLRFCTRSGNSLKPDRTWSEWSEPLADANGSRISSPNARYIQWKAEMGGSGGATPALQSVTVAYLPQNSPPVIKSINIVSQAVLTPAGRGAASSSSASASSSAPYTVTVSDSGDTASSAAGTPTQTLARAAEQQISVVWQAEDPDGDRLVYNLYFRGEDETQWKLLKSDLHESSLTFDANVLADGKYYFRVVASDREANPPATARESLLVSSPVLIDNTPPSLAVTAVSRNGGAAHIEWTADDAASSLRRAEYSLDATSWVPMEAVDGVIDSQHERFALDLTNLTPGEHLLVLRAADSANNVGVAKVVLR
ncbi:MAG: hypothetical protein ACLQVN_27045 [Bryobacteraceae bacterium]